MEETNGTDKASHKSRSATEGSQILLDPVSFTPGFSQVNCAELSSGNRLKRFPLSLTFPITRLKPVVNENLERLSCAKPITVSVCL